MREVYQHITKCQYVAYTNFYLINPAVGLYIFTVLQYFLYLFTVIARSTKHAELGWLPRWTAENSYNQFRP